MEWTKQFEDMSKADNRHVSEDYVGSYHISTVWLGLDHNYFGGRPLLFETMVFNEGSLGDIYMDRYTTWDESVEGHKKAVQWVKDGCKNDWF